MPHARSELLLLTCLAPQMNAAIARELAGSAAADELEALCAQGLLRTTASERGAIYEAHGLVRRGLEAQLRERLGAGAHAWTIRTAQVLEREGFTEDAFGLFADCAAFEHAADLLEALAERYARRRQVDLLQRSFERIPAPIVDARPWLCFWAGQAMLGVDEESARRWFERAYAAFERAGDAMGMRVAAARVVTAFGLEYGDLRALDKWMEWHDRAGGNDPIVPGSAYESVLALGAVCAAMMRGAHHANGDPDALVRRLRTLVDDDTAWLTPDEPVIAARLLIDHGRVFHDARSRAGLCARDTRPRGARRHERAAAWSLEHRRGVGLLRRRPARSREAASRRGAPTDGDVRIPAAGVRARHGGGRCFA